MLSLPLQSSNPDQYNGKYVASMLVNEGDTVVWWDPTTMQQYVNQLGPELVVRTNSTSAWNSMTATPVVLEDGQIKIAFGGAGFAAYSYLIVPNLSQNLKVGVIYRVSGKARVSPGGSVNINVYPGGSFGSGIATITSTELVSFSYFVIPQSNDIYLLATNMGQGETIWLADISIRELTGTEEALLFSDAAGLFPVTGLEQQVGLIRDRSVQTRFELRRNLFSNSANPYGSTWNWSNGYAGVLNPQERLVNGNFSDGLNGWTASSTSLPPYVQDGKLYLTRQDSPLILPSITSSVVFDPMRRYRIQAECSAGGFVCSSALSAFSRFDLFNLYTAAGVQTVYLYHNTASVPQPVASRRLYMHSHSAPYSVIDNLSVKQIDEGYVADPLGGNQAMPLVAEQALATWTETISISIAQTYTISVWIRRKSGTGAVELSCGAGTWASVPVTGEWAKHRISQSITTGTRTPGIRLATIGDEVEVFGFQFELGATDTDYQPTADRFPLSWRGNHGYQVTSTARPVLSARYNLVLRSENLADPAWNTGFNTAAIVRTANFATAPNGTTTATRIQIPAATGQGFRSNESRANATYVYTIWAKSNSAQNQTFRIYFGGVGDIGQSPDFIATQEWQKFTYTYTGAHVGQGVHGSPNVAADILVWGADLRVANEPAGIPTYQRVNTATDYDSQGFPPYLRFDGVDDFLVTNYIDFTNRDKVTLLAGVRKQVDTASQTVAHLGVDFDAEQTVFALLLGAPTAKYSWYSSGLRNSNLSLAATNDAAYSGSQSAVLEATGTRTPSLNTLRVNGQLAAQSSNSQGLGNFLRAQLYVGATAGTSRRLNGRIYGLIVLGDLADELHLTNARRYLANKSGIVL